MQQNLPNKSVGIVGVGNLLLRDEGFGVHTIRYLDNHYHFPESVAIIDGGTAGIMLAHFFDQVERLLIIDAVKTNSKPGTIHSFPLQNVQAASIQSCMSPHQVGLLEVIAMCRFRGRFPREVEFIGAVPSDLSSGVGLSPVLIPKMAEVAAMIIDRLCPLGINVECAG